MLLGFQVLKCWFQNIGLGEATDMSMPCMDLLPPYDYCRLLTWTNHINVIYATLI